MLQYPLTERGIYMTPNNFEEFKLAKKHTTIIARRKHRKRKFDIA